MRYLLALILLGCGDYLYPVPQPPEDSGIDVISQASVGPVGILHRFDGGQSDSIGMGGNVSGSPVHLPPNSGPLPE